MSEHQRSRGRPRDYARRGFGQVLQRHRLAHGLSREEVGDAAGVSGGYIAKLENSATLPRPELQRKLAEAVGVPVEQLFTEAEVEGRLADDPHAPPWQSPTDEPDPRRAALARHLGVNSLDEATHRLGHAPATTPPELPDWLSAIHETLKAAVPAERRDHVGRHVMRYAQRLVDAEVHTSDEDLEALGEVVRSLIFQLPGHDRETLRRAWHVTLAHLRRHDDPDAAIAELNEVLAAAYEQATGYRPPGW